MLYKHKNNRGFSEIELVTFIVLVAVIIVLVRFCQDMSHSSMIKKDIFQLTMYRNAVTEFKNKYGQLPGDFNNAKTIWHDCSDVPALNTTCNGNNDGFWDNNESYYVFEHLSRAEMLDDIYSATPKTDEKTVYPIMEVTGQSIVPIGALSITDQKNLSDIFFNYPLPNNSFMGYFDSNSMGDPIPTQKKVDALTLPAIDKKLDDGNGANGSIRAAVDKIGLFGFHNRSEDCTDAKGFYREDEDNLLYCNFIMKY